MTPSASSAAKSIRKKTLIKLIENDLEKRFRYISPKDIALYTAGTLVRTEDAEAWNSRVQKAYPDFQVTYHALSAPWEIPEAEQGLTYDNGFLFSPDTDDPPPIKKLKRDLEREALTRLEEAARTEKDFREIMKKWNHLDENRKRRERYH